MTKILDIKPFIDEIRNEIINGLKKLNTNLKPKCAFIRVGDNPASEKYVSLKEKACELVGIDYLDLHFPNNIKQDELQKEIYELNNDNSINGILVQMPLPEHIDEFIIKNTVDSDKDVDGISSRNILQTQHQCGSVGCLPATVLYLLSKFNIDLNQKTLLICGKSDVMSKPALNIFSNSFKDIIYTDYDSNNLKYFSTLADVIISCCNKPHFFDSDWLKTGSIFFDMGNSKISDLTKKCGYRLLGDLDYKEKTCEAAYITPVPGCMGPATIAMLTLNIYKSFLKQNNL